MDERRGKITHSIYKDIYENRPTHRLTRDTSLNFFFFFIRVTFQTHPVADVREVLECKLKAVALFGRDGPHVLIRLRALCGGENRM